MGSTLLTILFMVRETGSPKIEDMIYKGRPETDVEKIVGPEMQKEALKKEYLRTQLEKILEDDVLVEGALKGMSSEDADLRKKTKPEIQVLAQEYATYAKKYAAEIREAYAPEKSQFEPRSATQRLTPKESQRALKEAQAMPMPEAPLGTRENPMEMPEAPEEEQVEINKEALEAERAALAARQWTEETLKAEGPWLDQDIGNTFGPRHE